MPAPNWTLYWTVESPAPPVSAAVPFIGLVQVPLVNGPAPGFVIATVGAVLSTVRTVPVENATDSELPAASLMAGVRTVRSRRRVPVPEMVPTVTVRVVPDPLMPVIVAPVTPTGVRLKLAVAAVVTDSLKVTR